MIAKSWYTSKTIWIAILQGILGVLVAIGTSVPNIGWLIILKSIIDIILRGLTEKPISA